MSTIKHCGIWAIWSFEAAQENCDSQFSPELPLPSPIPSASPASSRGREGGVQKPSGSAFDREGAGLTKGLHPWLHTQPSKGTQPPSCSPWKMDWEKGKWAGNEMRFPQAHWNKANEAPEDHRPVGCPSWSFNLHSQKPSQQQSPQSLVLTRVSQPPRVKAHDPFPSSTCLPSQVTRLQQH